MEFFRDKGIPTVEVPASKSILLRILILSALYGENISIDPRGPLCDDTRAMIDCLEALGVPIQRDERIHMLGCHGRFPVKGALLNVRESAATARFLAAALAFCRGSATLSATGTLCNRPMGILEILRSGGAKITHLNEGSPFPFEINGEFFSGTDFTIHTDESTQYASAILLSAACAGEPVTVTLKGNRIHGGYLSMTLSLMKQFKIQVQREKERFKISRQGISPKQISAEADLSAACYFCALSLLKKTKIFLKNVHRSALQPDDEFLTILQQHGLDLKNYENGLLADGSKVKRFQGFDCDLSNCSDQALTAAALAPFAETPSHLRGISHIRRQECDRIRAILCNLTALGVPVTDEEDGVRILPAPVRSATIETFGDHRVAMAFALVGAATHIFLKDASCSKKTFEDYFDIMKRLELLDIAFD